MNLFLIIYYILTLINTKNLLQIINLKTCIKCIKMDRNSILYSPDLYYSLDQQINYWNSTYSLKLA